LEKAARPKSTYRAAQIGKIETMDTSAGNRFMKKGKRGFTMIELMIVLIIVAILLALAYPSYVQYVRKSKRGEAQQLLMNWSINQEIWRSNNPLYADTDDLPAPTHDLYDFEVGDLSATAYTLSATAKAGNDQENDKAKDGTTCALTLNQNGFKNPPACWD
jgi:type IV pilus assembly protein PilE